MAKRFFRKLAILAKPEVTYGTDSVPTGLANAMLMTDVSIEPLAGEEVSRDLYLPYLGHQGVTFVGTHVKMEGSIELAGAGAAGDVPAYGVLLRACGLAETITAGSKVEYEPVSANYEAASVYWNMDGVRHIALGVRGTVSLSLTPKQIPKMRFQLWGLLGTIADSALPTVDVSDFVRPIPVSKANTPTFTLFGLAAIAESLSIDLGNQVETRFLIGEESVQIVDRKAVGSAVLEAVSLATKDWYSIAKARTRGALTVVHGIAAGNIVQIDAPTLEIGRPTYGQTQQILNNTLPLMLCPNAGDDEFMLTVK
jgi:hypothetical protein